MDQIAKLLLSEESAREILRLKDLYPHRESAVLMVLHVVHRQFGYIDKNALKEAAQIMELPFIDFEQSASFYTLFPRTEVGKYHIQVCRTLSCYLNGAEELTSFLKSKLGIEIGQTTQDKIFSLVEVECLGSCGSGPMMQVNDTYYEHLTRAKVEKILDELREKAQHG